MTMKFGSIHTELRELLDKISSFVKFILPCGALASTYESVSGMHKNGAEKVQ